MTPEALATFEDLKGTLLEAPVLCRINYDKPFALQTDASLTAIGATLSQSDDCKCDYAVAYASKHLTAQQQRWDTQSREAFAVVWAMELFCPHLLGHLFTLVTDHSALTLPEECQCKPQNCSMGHVPCRV